MLTATQIIERVKRLHGISITERRVIAARRGGTLSFERDGRFLVSEEDAVDDWVLSGCPAGDSTEKAAAARPEMKFGPLDTRLLLDCQTQHLEREQLLDLLHAARLELSRMGAQLDAATRRARTAELAALRAKTEVEELETRLARATCAASRRHSKEN